MESWENEEGDPTYYKLSFIGKGQCRKSLAPPIQTGNMVVTFNYMHRFSLLIKAHIKQL